MTTRWSDSSVPRGDDYDARWRQMAASGQNIHGEADLVQALLIEHGGRTVLDAGCGTGRVAIELDRRGFNVIGVDTDDRMLAAAKTNAPDLRWVHADLVDLDHHLGDNDAVDLAVLAGNVMIFVEPGTEATVLDQVVRRLTPGGLLVAGFQLRPGRIDADAYGHHAEALGLDSVARWSTWDREPFTDESDYLVAVHRRPS